MRPLSARKCEYSWKLKEIILKVLRDERNDRLEAGSDPLGQNAIPH